MAQITVRNLDENVKNQLAMNAKLNGHSMEEEVRQIIQEAVERKESGLGTKIANRFRGIGLDFEIEEHKGQQLRNPFEDE